MRSVWMSGLTLTCLMAMGLLAAGCESNGKKMSSMDRSTDTVIMSGAHGQVASYTWSKKDNKVMASDGAPKCAECEMAAGDYFATGKLEPKCKACGAMRTIATGGSRRGANG